MDQILRVICEKMLRYEIIRSSWGSLKALKALARKPVRHEEGLEDSWVFFRNNGLIILVLVTLIILTIYRRFHKGRCCADAGMDEAMVNAEESDPDVISTTTPEYFDANDEDSLYQKSSFEQIPSVPRVVKYGIYLPQSISKTDPLQPHMSSSKTTYIKQQPSKCWTCGMQALQTEQSKCKLKRQKNHTYINVNISSDTVDYKNYFDCSKDGKHNINMQLSKKSTKLSLGKDTGDTEEFFSPTDSNSTTHNEFSFSKFISTKQKLEINTRCGDTTVVHCCVRSEAGRNDSTPDFSQISSMGLDIQCCISKGKNSTVNLADVKLRKSTSTATESKFCVQESKSVLIKEQKQEFMKKFDAAFPLGREPTEVEKLLPSSYMQKYMQNRPRTRDKNKRINAGTSPLRRCFFS